MRAITLRNLPPELAKLIEDRAAETGLSLDQTVIRLLEKGAGLRSGERRKDIDCELDHFAGSWSDEEAADFERALADQRRIDPELWE